MKINKSNIIKSLLVMLLFTFSCKEVDFGDTNVSPNSPTILSVNGLLSGAIRSLPGSIDATTPMLYVQYLSNGQYNGESQYSGLNWSYDGFYTGPIQNLHTIIKLNTDASTKGLAALESGTSNENQIAVAKILRVYYYQLMTNRWGMIPYFDANKGLGQEGEIYPKFNTQEEIYTELFKEINEAISLIGSGKSPSGDYLLGTMNRWKQFATNIKLIMALRLSRRNSQLNDLPKKMFNEAVNSGLLITSHKDNVYYPYITSDINDNPWDDRFNTRKDYLMSDTFMNVLNNNTPSNFTDDDPRISKYAEPTQRDPNKFIGAPYGNVNSSTSRYSFMNYDIIGYNDGRNDFPGIILTAAQIQFSLAEARELGWISTSTVADYYKKGIEESMKQWKVADTDATTYINANPYTNTKSIAKQKWIAMYMQGYESWSEWRRFNASGNAPALKTDFGQINGTGIIQRQGYSTTTAGSNKDNYDAAVAVQGPDNLDTKLWIFK